MVRLRLTAKRNRRTTVRETFSQWYVLRRYSLVYLYSTIGLQVITFHGKWFHDFGVAFDGDNDGLFVDSVAASGGCRKDLSTVREWKPHGEGSVRFDFDGFGSDGHVCIRMCGSEYNKFGFDVEVELSWFTQTTFGTASELGQDVEVHRAAESVFKDVGKLTFLGFIAVSATHGVDSAACRIPILGSFAMKRLNAFARAATVMAIDRLPRLEPAVRDGLLAPYDTPAHRVAIDGFVRDIPMKPSHPTYGVLKRLEDNLLRLEHLPTSLVWGMKDWCFTPECLRRFQEVWPRARVQELQDVGHYVMEEAAVEVCEAVRGVLGRV